MGENYFGITDTGKLRNNNEDTFIARTIENTELVLACVIDGVGGYNGGEVAASLARDTIFTSLNKTSASIMDSMTEALTNANEIIQQERLKSNENRQMACVLTLAIADITGNKFYYAHIGDTRLYLFRDDTLVKVTHDHSFVGLLEDSGRITEYAAMNHPKRNEIDKALGFDADLNSNDYIETGESPFLPGDIILLCSDGLSDMIDNNCMTSILTESENLSSKANKLITAANDAGGKDNITVVLVHNNKSPLKQTATKPVTVSKKIAETLNQQSVDPEESITEEITERTTTQTKRTTFLSVLCFCLGAAVLWLLYQNHEKLKNVAVPSIKKNMTLQEQTFFDSIETGANKMQIASQVNQPILITDSIIIRRDSLFIHGNGATLLRDSIYMGPGLMFASSCKYILLDSLTIENFDVGILMQNQALHLKNVQFKNCRIPVQYQFLLAGDTFINGAIPDSLYFHSDSLPQ